MNTTYRHGFLSGKSVVDNNSKCLVSGKYDLVIASSSWDRRCVCITDGKNIVSEHSILLFFEARDENNLRDKHDLNIIDFLETITHNAPVIVKGHSVDVEGMWLNILKEILLISKSINKPLNILLDLSTCPRYYALAIMATCFKRGLACNITIFYSEGIYGNTENEEVLEYNFTKGKWRTVPIPSLDGSCDPEKEKYFLVSVGFEGIKTIRAVHKADPDRISILFPDPGINPSYVQIAEEQNKELIDEFMVPEEQIIRVRAGDAIEAWKSLSIRSLERSEENIHYLICGPKPHAIGLGLRAISLGYPTVLYNVPEGHSVTDVQPSGIFWRYDIKDLSALS